MQGGMGKSDADTTKFHAVNHDDDAQYGCRTVEHLQFDLQIL